MEEVLSRDFVEFVKKKAGPRMGSEQILEIANYLLPRESNSFLPPSLPLFPPFIHSTGIYVSGSVVDTGDRAKNQTGNFSSSMELNFYLGRQIINKQINV